MSTLAVVEEIMRETGIPMTVRQVVEHAGSRLPTRSKTPDTVVARDLSMDIKRNGDASRFIRTSPGRYTLRELTTGQLATATRNSSNGSSEPEARRAECDNATSVLSSALRAERAGTLPAKSTTVTSLEHGRRAGAE